MQGDGRYVQLLIERIIRGRERAGTQHGQARSISMIFIVRFLGNTTAVATNQTSCRKMMAMPMTEAVHKSVRTHGIPITYTTA